MSYCFGCNGEGYVAPWTPCPTCNGSGVEPPEQPPEVPAKYYCPRHGWMATPCNCLQAIMDPGKADRSPEVQAPSEVWVIVDDEGRMLGCYDHDDSISGATAVARAVLGSRVVRYVRST